MKMGTESFEAGLVAYFIDLKRKSRNENGTDNRAAKRG
jgi:hypothetical protein